MYEFPTIWFIYSVWACRRYRKGGRWCKACGCRRVCKAKVCSRRVCRRVRCTRRVCHTVIKYRIVKYKYRNPHYYGYGSRYLWGIKKIPYRVRVWKNVRSFCHKCYNRRYYCGRVCSHVCRYRKVSNVLRLQDTLFGVLWKIATARSKSVRFSSNFHQMLASACKIWQSCKMDKQ
jgi:hypothetical protein